MAAVGGVRKIDDEDREAYYDVAGKKLKSKTGWNEGGNGTDEFGFSALPGGYRNDSGGSFDFVGYSGYWWSATEYGNGNAYSRGMDYDGGGVYEYDSDKSNGFSGRCVAQD
jgi:uncharacterized protein (TIGR02145 family)